jgi:MFS family permease
VLPSTVRIREEILKSGFAAFLGSMFLSKLADQILLFLVPLVVYQTTKSLAWSGLAFFAEALPRYLSFPVCGILCDRKSPLKLLKASQLYRAAFCVAGVGCSVAIGGVGWLVALSAVCGVLTTQGMMAREVMLPHIAKDQPFHKVLAHAQAADQAGFVLGPLVAAVLLDLSRWQAVVALAAVLFLLADAMVAAWQRRADLVLPDVEPAHGNWVVPIKTALLHVAQLPGLLRLVMLACGLNLVIGATLASSAALVTGVHGQTGGYYAGLQTAGALATILILFVIARATMTPRTLAVLSYLCVCGGGLLTALAPAHWVYALGFLLIVGFDKMFNIYIRTARQAIIPPKDYGKTTGVIIMLNNLSQPLAGLLIGAFAGPGQTGWVILGLSIVMACIGIHVAASRTRSSAVVRSS